MRSSDSQPPLCGFDLLLTSLAVALAMVCIPMAIEFSGGAGSRAMLLCCLIFPPAVALTFVHRRDGSPRSAPAPIRRDGMT